MHNFIYFLVIYGQRFLNISFDFKAVYEIVYLERRRKKKIGLGGHYVDFYVSRLFNSIMDRLE